MNNVFTVQYTVNQKGQSNMGTPGFNKQYTVTITEAQRRILQAVCACVADEVLDALAAEGLRDVEGNMLDTDNEVANLRDLFAHRVL